MSELSDLEYDIKISIAYHRKREYFYRSIDAAAKAISLVALGAIGVRPNTLTIILAILSAALTIATIVLDCAGMAARHGGLASRFTHLLSKAAISPCDVGGLRRDYHIIEADEPPELRGLVQLCQDEVDAAEGQTVDSTRFSISRRISAHFGFGNRPIDWEVDANS